MSSSSAKLWKKSVFFKYLLISVISGLLRVAFGCLVKFVNSVLGFLLGTGVVSPYLKAGITSRFLTKEFRSKKLIESENEVTQIDWKEIQSGAIGSVYRITLHYKFEPQLKASSSSTSKGNYARCTSDSLAIAPKTAIVKCSGEKLNQVLFSTIVGVTDMEFKILSKLPQLVTETMPDCFALTYCESGGLLCYVMEDYGSLRHESSVTGATLHDARLMILAAASYHLQTWNNTQIFDQFKFTNNNQWLDLGFPIWISKAQQEAGPLQDHFQLPNVAHTLSWLSEMSNMNQLLLSLRGYSLAEDVRYIRYPPHFVLGHGDFRLDNCFFDDERQVCLLIDWQVSCARHPIADLGWILVETKLEVLSDPKNILQLIELYVEQVNKKFSKTEITVREMTELLPFAITFVLYNVLVVNLALLDETTVKVMKQVLIRANMIFQHFGVPKVANFSNK